MCDISPPELEPGLILNHVVFLCGFCMFFVPAYISFTTKNMYNTLGWTWVCEFNKYDTMDES